MGEYNEMPVQRDRYDLFEVFEAWPKSYKGERKKNAEGVPQWEVRGRVHFVGDKYARDIRVSVASAERPVPENLGTVRVKPVGLVLYYGRQEANRQYWGYKAAGFEVER